MSLADFVPASAAHLRARLGLLDASLSAAEACPDGVMFVVRVGSEFAHPCASMPPVAVDAAARMPAADALALAAALVEAGADAAAIPAADALYAARVRVGVELELVARGIGAIHTAPARLD